MNHRTTLKHLARGLALSLAVAVAPLALHAEDAGTFAPPPHHHHGPGGPGGPSPLQGLTRMLELTDAQKAQIQPILDQAEPQLKAIHAEAAAKAAAVLQSVQTQIKPYLTADQQQELDVMAKRQARRAAAAQQQQQTTTTTTTK